MLSLRPSGAAATLFAVALLVAPIAGAIGPATLAKGVGEILVDAQGKATGANVEGRLAQTAGVVEGFRASGGLLVFEKVLIDGFEGRAPIAGAGSPVVTLVGSNAVVSLHDDLHSVLKVTATSATTVTYHLAHSVRAFQTGATGTTVKVATATGLALGALVVHGGESAQSRGETLQLQGDAIVARLQPGSEILFLDGSDALVSAIASGALASQYVTEFEGSGVAATELALGDANARTSSSIDGLVQTTIQAKRAAVLAYDLAYETLPAADAQDVAVYLDGELAERVSDVRDVLARARDGKGAFHVSSASGRTQVFASTPPGDHRVAVFVSAQATTEPQARAENGRDDESRVYGGFEYHANGKLTGAFVTSVIPEGRARLLGFTSLASGTEIFRGVAVDAGAEGSFHTAGDDEMTIRTPRADLTLVDDVHATLLLSAKAPVEALFELAPRVSASHDGERILLLTGPHGSVGALVLVGPGSLALEGDGAIRVALAPGSTLVHRAVADEHASEPSVLRALADGRIGAQVLAGVHDGDAATKVTRYASDLDVAVRPNARGALEIAATGAKAFVLDVRGSALAAKSAADIRVNVNGETISPSSSPEEVLDLVDAPRYFAQTSAEGALRLIVSTGANVGEGAEVAIESIVQEAAQAQARTDAFGEFRLFHDGTAVGSFVSLKADRDAGAVSGITLVASAQPVFDSFVVGRSAYEAVSGDGSSVLKLENAEASIEISDSTNAFTKLSAREATDAAFHLAAGLRAAPRSPGVVDLLDAEGRHVASLVAARLASLEARGEREVRANIAAGGEVLFRTHDGIESELSAAQRTMINQAIAAGRVAGHVAVQTQASATIAADRLESTAMGTEEDLQVAAVRAFGKVTSAVSASYGDVRMVTAATKERVEITIASTASEGKTLLVSLDPDTIPGMAKGKATIRFDGEIVAQASSYADILDATDDGDASEYFVLAGDAGTQVLVSIPHWSVHTVTLEEQKPRGDSLFLISTIFLGVLVLVEAALLARARANKARASQSNIPSNKET